MPNAPGNSAPEGGLRSGDLVRDERFGVGKVEFDKGETVLVRFGDTIHECKKTALDRVRTVQDTVRRKLWDSPIQVIARVQAEAIRSVNDAWSVFSRSRIALLPHQLWVCRQVNEKWPTRWVVADDVGLGKTIEAGLILTPLVASGRVRRFLVLCPASLVGQWQQRLREMFGIHAFRYVREIDTAGDAFWAAHPFVVASMETLRKDDEQKGWHDRLLSAPAWDLVLVDEAHRLGDDEQRGPTLGYKLLTKLQEEGLISSLIFFTGTPHRGKNFAFLSLLRLIDERFDPKRPLEQQLHLLRGVLIRNNKQCVTDLKGDLLFQPLKNEARTYSYSDEERRFYDTLTEFIVSGKAYASSLSQARGQAVMLVLISMQKLASSSVAAITRALTGRLTQTSETRRTYAKVQQLVEEATSLDDAGEFDSLSEKEELLAKLTAKLKLMEDEEERIRELIELGEAVREETKITEIIRLIDTELSTKSVLFFTEYKATQSLLLSALLQRYGKDCATFINGDNRAAGVVGPDGPLPPLLVDRADATAHFNSGAVRFLISTEAGGEGIDLQESCHILVHVDLPWNPMRLHQRVGRLNRYGQTHQVTVYSLRNPDTVESRIWSLLNTKIERIQLALSEVMDDPEDLFQLVLGMAPAGVFRGVFADAGSQRPEALSAWFDARTARFGGKDAIEAVHSIVGNCLRFDFQQVSDRIPRVDLPALRPFLESMLVFNRRRPRDEDGRLSFTTPDEWKVQGIRRSYAGLSFDRSDTRSSREVNLVGVGHRVFDLAVTQALQLTAVAAAVTTREGLKFPLVTFRISDRITGKDTSVRNVIAGVEVLDEGELRLLRDWELLLHLNAVAPGYGARTPHSSGPVPGDRVDAAVAACRKLVEHSGEILDLRFELPQIDLMAVLWPAEAGAEPSPPGV